MATLEELTPGAVVRGVVPGESVTVVATRWAGSRSVVLTFRTDAGRVDEQVVYRTQETELILDGRRRAWSFDGDGALFRLVAEARRIRLGPPAGLLLPGVPAARLPPLRRPGIGHHGGRAPAPGTSEPRRGLSTRQRHPSGG